MTKPLLALASAKSFGDFVIAHSMLHRVDEHARGRIRLIAFSHLKGLQAILPADVQVTLVDSGEDRVPAVFDVRKCGALAAAKSALTLRRRFQTIKRRDNEMLGFESLGIRERFLAGAWQAIGPRAKGANIYETYARFLAEWDIKVSPPPERTGAGADGLVGIFPESRLADKRLTPPTLALILERIGRAGFVPKVFILEGDTAAPADCVDVVTISRNFHSLATAIRSVNRVISADSLPAHLAEYLGRPVFVASSAPNAYWLPHGCFAHQHWGIFRAEAAFIPALDRFLLESIGSQSHRDVGFEQASTASPINRALASDDQ